MEFDTVLKALGSVASVGLAALLYAAALIYRRTGSLDVLLQRLWRWSTGCESVKAEAIQSFIDRQHSLDAFRFTTRLSADSLEAAEAAIAQIDRCGLAMVKMRLAARYLKADRNGLSVTSAPPLFWRRVARLALLPLSFGLVFAIVAAAPATPVIATFGGTRPYYVLLSPSDAVAVRHPFDTFRPSECRDMGDDARDIARIDRRQICGYWMSPAMLGQIRTAQRRQAALFALVAIELALLFVPLMRFVRRMHALKYVEQHLR